MLDHAAKDMKFVVTRLQAAGFRALTQVFGSSADPGAATSRDVDFAVVIAPTEKPGVVEYLRQLGGSPERLMNWAIDVFDGHDQTFGYNKRASGTLHILVMSKEEYEGNSPLAVNIRGVAR